MKRVFIIHGWGGSPDCGWLKWLNEELSKKGFKVYSPDMPDKEFPKIKRWVGYLKKIVGKVDEDTYFVGHSVGCQAIMRFLESQHNKSGGVVFVAGWLNLKNFETQEERDIFEPWIESKIDFNKLKNKISKTVALFSDNDPYVKIENSKIFKERLGAKIIIEKNKGHYIEDKTFKIPVLLKEFIKLTK